MRILIISGTGLIGSAIHARLSAEGHDCVSVSRHPTGTPQAHHVALDVAQAGDASSWKPVLAGAAVI
ncbi:NAD-dependent epimerase/dehydratase family protein [Bradyrhizobium valentinum]|uniref:NAD-dependent epimerase/dehydratase family protein n=1 Tax=Bradyrhizobium valentinum TaxID=1518501 RepID=UPI0018D26E7C|nr:NAD-dependent epimerase/dehydratase family protein [Bradyrhizobium valentinum]